MNFRGENGKMGVQPGNRPALPRDWFRGVPEWYVAGADTRGRQEGRPYPWSQQVIHEISELNLLTEREPHGKYLATATDHRRVGGAQSMGTA